MEPLDLEIRRRVADYLAGTRSIHDFREWFGTVTWNIEQRESPSTAALAREIELLLAEYEHGDWSDIELAEKLTPLVTRYSFNVGHSMITGSTSVVQQFARITPVAPLSARVDIRFAGVSA